jgi:tRNA pseudouridine(55) synthase
MQDTPSPDELCGILNLNKAIGLSSHDAVLRVRRITGQKKAGHAGTLDPLATGVLLVCLGQATRVSEYLMLAPKAYRARVRLGVTTDTYDAEGQVTAQAEVSVTRAQVDAVLLGLQGTFEQTPPTYSAIKRNGVPLYKLARRGDEGQRQAQDIARGQARMVHVESLTLVDWQPPDLEIEVRCSKGTYDRADRRREEDPRNAAFPQRHFHGLGNSQPDTRGRFGDKIRKRDRQRPGLDVLHGKSPSLSDGHGFFGYKNYVALPRFSHGVFLDHVNDPVAFLDDMGPDRYPEEPLAVELDLRPFDLLWLYRSFYRSLFRGSFCH